MGKCPGYTGKYLLSKRKCQVTQQNNLLSLLTLPLAPKVCSLYISKLKKKTIYDLPEERNHI
jgi:hypothetical protein